MTPLLYGTKPGDFETSKIHFPTSELSERASERVSGASERANGQASEPVLQSVFLVVLDYSEGEAETFCEGLYVKPSDNSKERDKPREGQ